MPRNIAPISLTGLGPTSPRTPIPEITWIDPCDLLVDDQYQRNPTERSIALIRRIVNGWDWARFKAPVCAWTEAGLEVMDGQHTAIAAATHPMVEKIPVLVVEAVDLADRAKAFLGINRDRLNITATQMHTAAVVAGDEDALTLAQVCERAGVRIVKNPPGANKKFEPGTTMAVGAIGALIGRCGVKSAREILQVLRAAECAPLTAEQIRAVELLVTDPEFAPQIEAEELTKTIVAMMAEAGQEAKVFAATHCIPRWRGLASVWFRKVKKRRPAASTPLPSSAPETRKMLSNMARVTDWRPPAGTRVDLGEPPPGRSALDQRNAKESKQ